MTSDEIKRRTLELYEKLPQDKESRMKCYDIRDEIFTLNESFFGYVAKSTFINNSSITYEDKFQSACLHFMECWWWYKWKGDTTHPGYRQDIAFSVFFKPRIGEMIERELNEVKYSIRRALCMKVGDQIGKHWGKVTYEDLADPRVKLSNEDMVALQAIFGTLYVPSLEDYEMFLPAPVYYNDEYELNEEYNSIEELLIHDMIMYEERLTPEKLKEMSKIYQIDLHILQAALPKAEETLKARLLEQINNQ